MLLTSTTVKAESDGDKGGAIRSVGVAEAPPHDTAESANAKQEQFRGLALLPWTV